MTYLYDSTQNPPGMLAVVRPSHPLGGFVFHQYREDPLDPAQQYGLLSRPGISPATTPADYRMIVNANPVTLSPVETGNVTYGIVLGNSLSELQTNADTTIQLYRSVLADIKEPSKEQRLLNVFALDQNFLNPFNPSTTIRYELSHASRVSLRVYDTLGQEVATLVNETKTAGVYNLEFDAGRLASGVYFYRIQAGDFVQTKKMILVKYSYRSGHGDGVTFKGAGRELSIMQRSQHQQQDRFRDRSTFWTTRRER